MADRAHGRPFCLNCAGARWDGLGPGIGGLNQWSRIFLGDQGNSGKLVIFNEPQKHKFRRNRFSMPQKPYKPWKQERSTVQLPVRVRRRGNTNQSKSDSWRARKQIKGPTTSKPSNGRESRGGHRDPPPSELSSGCSRGWSPPRFLDIISRTNPYEQVAGSPIESRHSQVTARVGKQYT